ncbi:hypothetical protein HPB51_024910 [Rhipicephalus microplus]|uniref:Liprin-beta-1/2 coiled-coil domain-containing protein n=1 Tax=Rhipicephalus microplus TaxID=6941 RepID=A0A9J6DWZ6_RHIMP|nr:hypothetical protein HPB51_024910 [Rhipicephalus microplus]
MYYGPPLQSSLSRRAWAEVGGVVDMMSEDPANSSPSTSGYSTPWSASLQRSQARRRLDHLDDRGGADDEDDDDDGGTSTPTPLPQPAAHQRPSDAAADSWSSGADWRSSRPPRRRRPARSSDHERGRSPSHARQPWVEERRSLDACDPHLLAVMAAAAQPWIAAAASSPPATPCCCSPPPQHCAHGCGSHAWASQQQRRRGCCCGVAAANWTPSSCGRCFAEPHSASRGSACQSWIGGGRCKTPVSGDYGDLQDKMSHLEAEKENLALQVSVLSDQLELQKDKIAELESSLLDKKLLLERTEQLLKQEMTLKKKIENDRLELLSDVPALKLKLVTAEREKSELESKVKKLETDVVLLRSHLAEREAELITRCGRVPASPHHGSVSSVADSFRATPTKLDDAFNLLICKDCNTVDAIIKECQRFEAAKSRGITHNFVRLPNTAATWSCEDGPALQTPLTAEHVTKIIRRELEALSPASVGSHACDSSPQMVPLVHAIVRQELSDAELASECTTAPSQPIDRRQPPVSYAQSQNLPARPRNPAE